jgi:hypothetical protein
MIFAAILACLPRTGTQATTEDLLREKLKSPFLSKAPWATDYDKAREASASSGKPILAYFTRSFAPCVPCSQLEGTVLLTGEFAKLADRYVLFCHITSQAQGEKYQDLLAEKGGQGWPSVFFLDSGGNVLARHAGPLTVEGIDAAGEKPRAFLDLKRRSEKGGPPEKIEFILARLETGQLKPGEAEDGIRGTGGTPSAEQRRRLDELVANVEVEAILRPVKSEETKNAAAKTCYERRKSGKAAPTVEPWRGAYWNLVLERAQSVKDVEVFEEALQVLKEKYSKLPDALKYLRDKEMWLKKQKENP